MNIHEIKNPNGPEWTAELSQRDQTGSVFDDLDHVQVQSAPADGAKCERCWRYVPDVANDPNYPTVCLRCADALAAIHYPPYTSEGTEPQA